MANDSNPAPSPEPVPSGGGARPGRILITRRLILRPAVSGDVAAWVAFETDPQVMRYIEGGYIPSCQEIEASLRRSERAWAEHDMGWWSVVRRDDDQVIGNCVLDISVIRESEVGYILDKASWGLGYATEAAGAVTHYGLNILRLPGLMALVRAEHAPSARVLEKLGYRKAGDVSPRGRRCSLFLIDAFPAERSPVVAIL